MSWPAPPPTIQQGSNRITHLSHDNCEDDMIKSASATPLGSMCRLSDVSLWPNTESDAVWQDGTMTTNAKRRYSILDETAQIPSSIEYLV